MRQEAQSFSDGIKAIQPKEIEAESADNPKINWSIAIVASHKWLFCQRF